MTSSSVPAGYDQHHIFPQQYIDYFASAGINIHNYCYAMPRPDHQQLHSDGWNPDWDDFFDNNPYASQYDIYNHAFQMMIDYGIDPSKPLIPYGR